MTSAKKSAAELLEDAKRVAPRESLQEHRQTIATLRAKNYTWREIAQFLVERGVDTDHTKVFRFMQPKGDKKMTLPETLTVPTSDDYVNALTAVSSDISENQRKMLEHHYRAHNRTVTFGELASAAGYADYRAANLHYGKLGSLIGDKVGMQYALLDETNPESDAFYSSAIGSGSHYRNAAGEFQLIMHHEIAKAIARLGWFK